MATTLKHQNDVENKVWEKKTEMGKKNAASNVISAILRQRLTVVPMSYLEFTTTRLGL